jgi:transcriptional regulator with GAF, ATPase, and Fis domain
VEQLAEIEKYGMPRDPEPDPDPKDPEEGLTDEQRAERARIIAALSDLRHNVTEVAARLGLRRGTLNAKIERYRIPGPPPSEAQRALTENYGMPRTPRRTK